MNKKDFVLLLYQGYIASVQYNLDLGLVRWSPAVIFASHVSSSTTKNQMDDPRLNRNISQLWHDRKDMNFSLWELVESLLVNNSFWLFASFNNKVVEGQHRFMALQLLALMGIIDWNKSKILHIEKTRQEQFTLLIPIQLTPDVLIRTAKTRQMLGSNVRALASLEYDKPDNITYFNSKFYYKINHVSATDMLFKYYSIAFPVLFQKQFFNQPSGFPFIDLYLTMTQDEALKKIKEYKDYYGGERYEVYRRNL